LRDPFQDLLGFTLSPGRSAVEIRGGERAEVQVVRLFFHDAVLSLIFFVRMNRIDMILSRLEDEAVKTQYRFSGKISCLSCNPV
jgi:hypothetical protein